MRLALYEPGFPPWAREALHAVAELGAVALVTPEYRAQDPLPLFPPYPAPPAHERANVDAALDEIGALAARFGARVALEPLTPFEGRFWRDAAGALRACQRLNNPLIGLALDFHNMLFSEANTAASIREAGAQIAHIHLADSNRRLPGQGQIDFAPGLAALREIDYDGYHSFECAVAGDFAHDLGATISWLRSR